MNIATINVTLQFLDIYRYKYKLYNSIDRYL